jgi:uncharacterized protein (DUF2267 family)
METQAFYRTVRERIGQCDREEAKRGTAAVFHALRDRLIPQEADQVVAQLPLAAPRIGHFAIPETLTAPGG